MNEIERNAARPAPVRWLASIGPAIIVASVVLGPGSILTASKVGTEFGYDMLWVLAIGVALMIAMVALCARLGSVQRGSMCDELTVHIGRAATVGVGLIIFLIVACFQTGNNRAVLAVVEPMFVSPGGAGAAAGEAGVYERVVPSLILVVFNAFIVVALFALRGLYKKLEVVMKVLIALMVIAFLANLLFAKPSLVAAARGLAPSLPDGGVMPVERDGAIVDPLWAVQGMLMTTFSVAGAFYQGYLVRERGWTADDAKQGLRDSVIGITTLGLLTAMIMMTSAAVLHGTVDASDLKSLNDVAAQIEPLFGPTATLLFSAGIFAGAFNSFIINAMIGGTIFADSLGLGSKIEQKWPRVLTTAALMVGMIVAILSVSFGVDTIGVIVFAQALTVLGVPILAFAVLWLATRQTAQTAGLIPMWMKAGCVIAVVLSVALAVRTAFRLYLQLT